MKSLILTSLYLVKDTLYRWKDRPSSPLSRMLVVFFLSLCALAFMATYVLSTRNIQNEIRTNGGDIILVSENDSFTSKEGNNLQLITENINMLGDVEMVVLRNIFGGESSIDGRRVLIMEYGDESLRSLHSFPLKEFPYLALLPENNPTPDGPGILNIEGYHINVAVRRIPDTSLIAKAPMTRDGLVLLPEGTTGSPSTSRSYIIRVKNMSYKQIEKIHSTLDNIRRMDNSMNMNVMSQLKLLKRLEFFLQSQMETRAGFSLGIAVIVGILLTALASMEFRQNEYVYTLMKSFGVHPLLLVCTFIAENALLVLVSFIASVYAFMHLQGTVLKNLLNQQDMSLSLSDIRVDLLLILSALGVCVFVSAIPIAFSAFRQIGRVLK